MGDFEAILADVSYLMAMEKSKTQSTAIVSKKIILPDTSVRNIMQKYLEKTGELTFEKIFVQRLGFLLFKEFCQTFSNGSCPQINFYEAIQEYEKMETPEERLTKAQEIYDKHIMPEMLNHTHNYSKETLQHVQRNLMKNHVPADVFKPYVSEIFDQLKGETFQRFVESDRFTRFCQWKNYELNMQLTMDDFTVHRTLGRGGFGLVSGCRKADTGKMFAMKCMEKKRIKMRQGETLALNERMMLSLASTGDYCPFIVCMTYAFQTPDKLVFILDLMQGGDLHYHLTQHGVFSEAEMKFYAAELTLGLEHMHNRFIVYRDLKPPNVLLEENGHIRISDLGLACEFSKNKPHSTVGTRGYMAPEVLAKGVAYDSSADWFSFGCTLFVLLKNHSPFKQSKGKNKQAVDDLMESMQDLELPSSLSPECRDLLEQLLKHNVNERLACKGGGASEIKNHPFFKDIDWQRVFLKRYPPPLIPPRGEVNAADQFDIGNFDEDAVKGIKLAKTDEELYKNFNIVISERWQQEIADTIFERVNQETDKLEQKKRSNRKVSKFYHEEKDSDVIVHGYIKKLGGPFTSAWQMRYGKLYPSRLELHPESENGKPELYFMDQIEEVGNDLQQVKNENCIIIKLKEVSQDTKLVLTTVDEISLKEWHTSLRTAHKVSFDLLRHINPKAIKIYGINRDPMLLEG